MTISLMHILVQALIVATQVSMVLGRTVQNSHLARHVARFGLEERRHLNAIVDSAGAVTGAVKKGYDIKGVARAEATDMFFEDAAQQPATATTAAPAAQPPGQATTTGTVATSLPPAVLTTLTPSTATTITPSVGTTVMNAATTLSPGSEANGAAGTAGSTTQSSGTTVGDSETTTAVGLQDINILKIDGESTTAKAADDESSIDDGTLMGMILGLVTLFAGVGCLYAVLRSQYNFTSSPGGVAIVHEPCPSDQSHDPSQDPAGEIDRRLSYAERRRSRVVSNSPIPGVGLPGLEPPTNPVEDQLTPRGRASSNYAAKRSGAGGN